MIARVRARLHARHVFLCRKPKAAAASRAASEGDTHSWKVYVSRAIADYLDHHSEGNVCDEDVVQALHAQSLDAGARDGLLLQLAPSSCVMFVA